MGRFKKAINPAGALRSAAGRNLSMRARLFTLLSAGVVLMAVAVVITLVATGLFRTGKEDAEKHMDKEFSNIYSELNEQCGAAAVQLVNLSHNLSRSMEANLSQKRIPPRAIQDHPDVLEEIISNELDLLELAFERTKCSGVFLVLDATVNPALPDAGHSRAGVYINIIEPYVSGSPNMTYYYLRGFPKIAYNNGLLVQSKWEMEFDVEGRDYYHLPIEKSRERSRQLPDLCYWGMESLLTERDEAMLVCSAPILDSDGLPFGVCGFVISGENFMSAYAPDAGGYEDILFVFGPLSANGLDTLTAMFGGRRKAAGGAAGSGTLLLPSGENPDVFKTADGKEYYGRYGEVRLYSNDSVFAELRYAGALLVAKAEIDAAVKRAYINLALLCLALIAFGVTLSVFISKKFVAPIKSALSIIREDNINEAALTNIAEIDDLMLYLKEHDDKKRGRSSAANPADFGQFLENLKTLTETEQAVFTLYMKDMSAQSIANEMFVSINTIRYHNKNIYKKLGVSSLDALRVYISMMKEKA